MNTQVYKHEDNQKVVQMFWLVVFSIVLTLTTYAFLINKTVSNIVSRQNNSAELSSLNSKIAELETEHIQLQNSISPEYAKQLGFNDVTNPQYISLAKSAPSLSLNTIH